MSVTRVTPSITSSLTSTSSSFNVSSKASLELVDFAVIVAVVDGSAPHRKLSRAKGISRFR